MRMLWAWWQVYKKFFLNVEKKRGVRKRIRKLIVEEKEITDHKEISNNIKAFYEALFKRNFSKTNVEKQQFLNYLSTKTLTNEWYDLGENKIRKTDLFSSMKSIKNNKTLCNNGLQKNFAKLSGMNWKLLLWKVSIKFSRIRP